MNKKGYLCGSLMLIFAAFFWGTTFIAQSNALDYIGPFTLSALRSVIAFPLLLLLYFAFNGKKALLPFKKTNLKHTLFGGIACGTVLFFAMNLQNHGLLETPPGEGGFITALYIVFVPVISLIFGKKPHITVWIFAAVAVFGFYLLNITDGKFSVSIWELSVLLSALFYSFHIIACEKFGNDIDAILLSCIQFASVAVLSAVFSFLDFTLLGFDALNTTLIKESAFSIIYCAVFSSALAYTLQIIGQKKVSSTAAVLLMSLESVFAVATAWIIAPKENALSAIQIVGCILILLAICAAQLPFSEISKKRSSAS